MRSAPSFLDDAKKEALENAEKAVAELKRACGFPPRAQLRGRFHIHAQSAARGILSSSKAPGPEHLPCPICHFKTTPHHDRRMHWAQKTKKPFTVEELMEKASGVKAG